MAAYRVALMASQSARIAADFMIALRSAADFRLMRALHAFDNFTESPQALVTTVAVKFNAIGMDTLDHIGSTF